MKTIHEWPIPTLAELHASIIWAGLVNRPKMLDRAKQRWSDMAHPLPKRKGAKQ